MFDEQQSDELNNNEENTNLDSDVTDDSDDTSSKVADELIDEPVDTLLQSDVTDIPEENSKDADIDSETPVTVQPVQFASFDEEENIYGKENKNLDLLMNVNLQMSVELGRTELPFKKVLELTRGSIISLNKLAGEPVELFANGKLVAFGEVVVIEDNFGLRITSIAAPEERFKTVHDAKNNG